MGSVNQQILSLKYNELVGRGLETNFQSPWLRNFSPKGETFANHAIPVANGSLGLHARSSRNQPSSQQNRLIIRRVNDYFHGARLVKQLLLHTKQIRGFPPSQQIGEKGMVDDCLLSPPLRGEETTFERADFAVNACNHKVGEILFGYLLSLNFLSTDVPTI